MSKIFKNNNFDTSYKKRPNDEYKNMIDKLPEEYKQKLDRQRNVILSIVVVFVIGLIVILAFTGLGVDDTISGQIFVGASERSLSFFGDSFTEGYVVEEGEDDYICEYTYADAAADEILKEYPDVELDITNDGITGDVAEDNSYTRVDENTEIVIMLYGLNNFLEGEDYEGVLEANITGLETNGSIVFLVTYPVYEGGEYEDEVTACNEYIEEVSESEDVVLLDAASQFNTLISDGQYTQDELFSSDHLHLSETGYQELGEYVGGILCTVEVE